ncbi:type II toxin-antitoxin system RelE/ParE family toxin [Prosthecobacter sp.]|uniref:type II toxin-antitoxin system RelE/ParE family toxin n=1 Tax=Prosthecobacter sp. TaxID=1965333 RepID=UPI003784B390
MKAVVLNPVAVNDLDEIEDYIAQDNLAAAEEVRQDILDTAERLGQQPAIGVRPRFSAPRFVGIRFLPADHFPTYLLFYHELEDEIEVLRVLHGARNLPPLFE